MCQIDLDIDGDTAALVTVTAPIARTYHTCTECGETIHAGEAYEEVVGLWEDGFSTYKTCLPCREIREHFFTTWYYGGIWAEMTECINEISFADLDALSPAAVGKLESMFQPAWDELWDDECGDAPPTGGNNS